MNIPIKHHYLPRFYINNWNNSRGLVTVFFKDERVIEVSSRDICFEKNLYTRREGNVEIESEFFSEIDAKAAQSIKVALDQGISGLEVSHREHIAHFIDTLQPRSPELLNPIKAFGEEKRQEYQSWERMKFDDKGESHRETTLKDKFCDTPYLLKLHSKGEDYERILNSHWFIFDNTTNKDFLTCDSPHLIFSLKGPDRIFKLPDEYLMTLPLTPKKILIISSLKSAIRSHIGNAKEFIVNNNEGIIKSANNIIIANNKEAERFIFRIRKSLSSETSNDGG